MALSCATKKEKTDSEVELQTNKRILSGAYPYVWMCEKISYTLGPKTSQTYKGLQTQGLIYYWGN